MLSMRRQIEAIKERLQEEEKLGYQPQSTYMDDIRHVHILKTPLDKKAKNRDSFWES